MPDREPFDAQRALRHTANLCFPRGAGTPRERQAARYILRQFAAVGLDRRREPFAVPRLPMEVGMRCAFVACAGLTWLGAASRAAHPSWAALAWLGAAVLVNSPWRLATLVAARLPSRASSSNLLATLPEAPIEAPARVVFMAHYDTKSQLLPTGLRVGFVTAVTILCALLAIGALAAAAGFPRAMAGPLPSWVVLAMAALLAALTANLTGNRSPGALDNGSGVGTLLELARSWRPRPEAPVEVVWVASGSEEVSLDGARHLLSRHEGWWEEKPTLLINLDSVGAGDHLRLAGERHSLVLAEAVAGSLGLPRRRLGVLGAGMDHEPFAARDLAAVSILGDVVSKGMAMHSARDTLRLIEAPALDRAGRLAAHLAWTWAERHRLADGWGGLVEGATEGPLTVA